MSVNKHRPHIIVLPEDDANRQIANGFLQDSAVDVRQIQVLPNAGGWIKARDAVAGSHVDALRTYSHRYLVVLIDFDGDTSRRGEVFKEIPQDVRNRIFVIGALREPEDLRLASNLPFEAIGRQCADECRLQLRGLWDNDLLRHNAAELDRMLPVLRPILFP